MVAPKQRTWTDQAPKRRRNHRSLRTPLRSTPLLPTRRSSPCRRTRFGATSASCHGLSSLHVLQGPSRGPWHPWQSRLGSVFAKALEGAAAALQLGGVWTARVRLPTTCQPRGPIGCTSRTLRCMPLSRKADAHEERKTDGSLFHWLCEERFLRSRRDGPDCGHEDREPEVPGQFDSVKVNLL